MIKGIRQKFYRNRKLFLFLALPIFLYVIDFIVGAFIIGTVKIEGSSMAPNLNTGDRVFIKKIVGKIERGDIIVYQYPQNPSTSFVHRVIGLPGETVEHRHGKVPIDGKQLDEPYIEIAAIATIETNQKSTKIPEDHYYLLEDNRLASNDSRFWGTLPRKMIYGKVVWCY